MELRALSLLYFKEGNEVQMEHPYKEVYFCEYCPKCVHYKKKEDEEPCCDCLDRPNIEWSHKPVYFEEKESK